MKGSLQMGHGALITRMMAERRRYSSALQVPGPVVIAVRGAVGAVLAVSGLLKVINQTAFVAALESYGIFSKAWIDILSLTVPQIEVIIGLLFAFGLQAKWLGRLIAFQLLVFTVAGGLAYSLGRAVDCGCFPHDSSTEPIGMGYFLRNGLLILAVLWVASRTDRPHRQSA